MENIYDIEKTMTEDEKKKAKELTEFFGREEIKEKFEQAKELFELSNERIINELESKANSGDKEAIIMVKYRDIILKLVELMGKADTKEIEKNSVIECFDNALKELNK